MVVPSVGRSPVALGPVGTSSITDVCGNWGGWEPFTAEELGARYGDLDGYLARYERRGGRPGPSPATCARRSGSRMLAEGAGGVPGHRGLTADAARVQICAPCIPRAIGNPAHG